MSGPILVLMLGMLVYIRTSFMHTCAYSYPPPDSASWGGGLQYTNSNLIEVTPLGLRDSI